MTTLLISILIAGIAAALLTLSTHLLLWKRPWRLKRTQAYMVGTAQIGLVITTWALITNHPEAALAFWGIAGCAGSADLSAWWFRRRLRVALDEAADDAFQRGRIYGSLATDEAAPIDDADEAADGD